MKVISLFSGAGGLDLGFKKAGAEIVYANDIQRDFCKTYRRNVGPIERRNILDVRVEEVPGGEVVIGGFPCLGFTIARGHRRSVDPRKEEENFLYKEFLRVVERKGPKAFLMENVPGIREGARFEKMFGGIISECRNTRPGYVLEHRELNALHFGVPQNRKRIFILGVREDAETCRPMGGFLKDHPFRTHLQDENAKLSDFPKRCPVTIRQAIGDLPLEESDSIPNHVYSKHRVEIRDYQGNRPLDWDSPSPTITGRGSLTGGPVIHPHPSLERRLSVRECARLQSFPDDFLFEGSMSKGYAQVGNAVPPLFAFRLAQAVMMLLGHEPRGYYPEEWNLPWADEIPALGRFLGGASCGGIKGS